MSDAVSAVLLAMTFLVIKHTFADYIFQTPYQFQNKGTYGHPGGFFHAGIHAVLTTPVFFILPPPTAIFGIGIIVFEFVVHYHIDWTKEHINKRFDLQHTQGRYWHLFGVDQLAHSLTYLAIVALLAN